MQKTKPSLSNHSLNHDQELHRFTVWLPTVMVNELQEFQRQFYIRDNKDALCFLIKMGLLAMDKFGDPS